MTALFYSVLFSCGTIYAQNVKGTAIVDCPKEYSIEIQVDSIIQIVQLLPSFATIEVMAGPQISRNTSIIYKEGKIINEYSQKYTYVLRANVGIHIIPAFQIKDSDGCYYNVPEVTIASKEKERKSVVNATNSTVPVNDKLKEKSNQIDNSKELVSDSTILVLSLDKSTVNIGEPVLVTVKLATCEQITSIVNVKYEFDYCYTERIVNTEPLGWETETINGIRYQTTPLLQYRLRPLQSGDIVLHPIEIQITKAIRVPDSTDMLFGMSLQYVKQSIKSDALVLKVIGNSSKEKGAHDIKPSNNNLLVALDISGSMRSYDFDGTRLDVAKRIASSIKRHYPQTHILPFASKFGDVIYNTDKFNDIDSLNIRDVDGSAMYDIGLFSLCNGIPYNDILLITDGNDNASHISRKTFTDLMAVYGIRVHVIIINSNKEKIEADLYDTQNNLLRTEIDNDIADISILKDLTKSTGGKCVEVKNELDVDDAISQISIAIEKKAKKRRPSKLYNIENDMVKLIVSDYYKNNYIR